MLELIWLNQSPDGICCGDNHLKDVEIPDTFIFTLALQRSAPHNNWSSFDQDLIGLCESQKTARLSCTFPEVEENKHGTVFWQETVTNIKICRQVTSTRKTYCWAFQYIDESVCTIILLCSLFAEWSESWSPLHRLLSHSFPHQLYSGPCKLLTVRRNELLSLKLCCQQLAVEQIKRPTP
jgi:hypothetical protein